MADLPRHLMYTRMGVNSTATSRTGAPSTWYWVPVLEDGIVLNASMETQNVPTEHKTRGTKYRVFTRRNFEGGSINTPVFAANAGLLFDAAINTNTADLPSYHTVESYWGSSSDTGLAGGNVAIQNNGVLFNGFTLSIDRDAPGPLTLQLDAFLNEYKALTSDQTPTWPPLNPHDTRNVYIDLDLGESGWSGDNADVRSLTVTYNNAIELSTFTPNSTATLNGTWTKAAVGTPTLTVEATLIMSDSTYPFQSDTSTLKTAQLRVMGYNPSASGSTTCTQDLTAGSNVNVQVASASGFAAGDVVLLEAPDGDLQAVASINAASVSGNSFDIDELDVTMAGSSTAINVYNTGWELKIDSLEITGHSRPTIQGNNRIVTLQMEALLASDSVTSLLSHHAYNDDNA